MITQDMRSFCQMVDHDDLEQRAKGQPRLVEPRFRWVRPFGRKKDAKEFKDRLAYPWYVIAARLSEVSVHLAKGATWKEASGGFARLWADVRRGGR